MTMVTLYKAADTSRVANITATADPDLQFPLAAASKYLVRGQFYVAGTTAGDFKIGWSLGGATLTYAAGCYYCWNGTQAAGVYEQTANRSMQTIHDEILTVPYTQPIPMTTGQQLAVKFVFMVQTGDTGGTFSLNWAQSTSDGTGGAKVLAGAIMQYEQLS